MRFFNTAGPIEPDIHYYIPPLERIDLDEVLLLIGQRQYFVLHAPRQTGKTSALLALMDELNGSEQYRCVYINTVRDGLEQTRAYMDRCGVLEGHLVVFDRRVGKSWDEKVFRREEVAGDAKITVWGM